MPERLVDRLSRPPDLSRDEPMSRQIADAIWVAVVQGALMTGERLPTTRQLAVELGISPRSVQRAYAELEERGVVSARPGEGTFVSLKPPDEAELERHQKFAELCRDTFRETRELGFGVDDLIDSLTEFRAIERGEPE